jgi:manganese/zinc/iron transport system permease protein
MFEFEQAFWTIFVGAVCGVACALLGCFLLLRRLSLLGDAISHGVLPGIAIAVLLTGELNGVALILGALAFGMLTVFLTESLTTFANVSEDASLGVVFTTLFAIGIVMVTVFLSGYHLDVDCVLYGRLELIPIFNPISDETWFGVTVPRPVPSMLFTLGLTIVFLTVCWKELKIVTFDPALATAMGFRARLVSYVLVGLVAATTVTSFEAVGSILVLAMLVVPAATAHLITDRLSSMLAWASAAAVSASALGYLFSSPEVFNCNAAGMIATVAGLQFTLALLFAPRHGLVPQLARRWRLALRIAREEILGVLYRSEEIGQPEVNVVLREHSLSPTLVRMAFLDLRRRGWIAAMGEGRWRLTDLGRREGESIVRAHRLWEAFLDKNFELPLDHLHAPASRVEHFIGPELQTELAAQLPQPVDPHGKQIPNR